MEGTSFLLNLSLTTRQCGIGHQVAVGVSYPPTQVVTSEPSFNNGHPRKSNAEFRNEVHEILARHESSFDQVNATLQTVLTELQALRVSRTHHTSHQKVNPFAPGEPSNALITNRTAITQERHHQHLKLTFPKFNEEDLFG